MKKPSWNGKHFGAVELIAVTALVGLAMSFAWPIFARSLIRPDEMSSILRLAPPKERLKPTSPLAERRNWPAERDIWSADMPELALMARSFLGSPEVLDSVRRQVVLKPNTVPRDNAELERWLKQRIRIEPIKDTFLLQYSGVVENPSLDFDLFKAAVSASLEHFHQVRPLGTAASIVDPPAKSMPGAYRFHMVYLGFFWFTAISVSFLIVKLAQLRDSRPRFSMADL